MRKLYTGLSALLAFALPLHAACVGGGGDGDKKPTRTEKTSLSINEDMVLEVLSTSAMTGPRLTQGFPWLGPILEARYSPELEYEPVNNLFDAFDRESRMSSDALAELLRMFSGKAMEEEGSYIDAVGQSLLLVHNQATVDKLKATYQHLLKSTSPKLRMEYLLYDLGPDSKDAQAGVLSSEKGAALFQQVQGGDLGRILHHGQASVRTGDALRVGRQHKMSILGEVDVEIAQESMAGDPVLVHLDLGQELALRPILSSDGDHIAVLGLFTSRELHGGVLAESLVAKGLKSIDQVRIDHRQSAFSLKLADGQAYLLAPGGAAQPGLRVLLRMRRPDSKPQDPAGFAIVPTGLLSTTALRGGKNTQETPTWLTGKSMGASFVSDATQSLLSSDDDTLLLQNYPEFLFVRSKEAEKARRIVRRFSADLERSFVVEVRREVQRAEDPNAAWTAYGETVRFDCLGKRLGYAMSGYEQSYTADYEVEVAQKASIGDPKQRACFIGFRGWAAVLPAGESMLVHLDLRDSSLLDWRRVAAPTETVGDITVPSLELVRVQQQLMLKQGESRSLGEGARREIHGLPHRTRLSVKLIER